jgi:protein-S-isoprenylcysteine O-methyltransferase Ste14
VTTRLVLRAIAYTAIVPGLLTVVIPWLILRANPASMPSPPWLSWPGPILMACGALLIAWCVRDFVRSGGGTPSPVEPPVRLVESGPFRWSRNPLYLGILGMLLGEALWWWSSVLLTYAVGTWMSLELFLQVYEEPSLEHRFGDAYRAYRRRVRRWLGRSRAPSG